MKKFSKILSSALVVCLLVSCLAISTFAATNPHTYTVKVDKSVVEAGDTVVVTVELDNSLDVWNAGYDLYFDPDVFTINTESGGRGKGKKYVDATWYTELTAADGILTWYWGKATESESVEEGRITYGWTGDTTNGAIPTADAQDNFVIGKFCLTVIDGAKAGTTNITINGETFGFKENAADAMTYVPATLTVAGEEEEKVVEIGTVSGATEAGAAVKPEYGTHKYDNAYVVTVNLTNEKNGDVVGVEFIPTEVLKYAGITEASTEDEINAVWATSAAKTTFGAVLGEGKAEYKAALINIPSFLAGKEFEIQARAFKTVGEDTTYAGAVKQKITYTVTAEPDRD